MTKSNQLLCLLLVGASLQSRYIVVAFNAPIQRANHVIPIVCNRNSVICNASSSPIENVAAIDSYKSLPEVDDGLGPLSFGVTDSLSVPDDARPTLIQTLTNPRDMLAIVLLIFGGCSVAYDNVLGIYDERYEMAEQFSIALGFLSVIAVIFQLQTSYLISDRRRMGLVDDASLNLYAGLYSLASCWLALRTSAFCPTWLTTFDFILPWLASAIFTYSLAAPAITLFEHFNTSSDDEDTALLSTKIVQASRFLSPTTEQSGPSSMDIPTKLSETELFRVKGLLFIGIIGCVFVPCSLVFAFQGQEWWQRVIELHPKQTYLESSDALYAIFATEASMIATRAADAGVAPYRKTVPAFGAVCLLLALVPCAFSLWWLGGGDDISFFSFYTE